MAPRRRDRLDDNAGIPLDDDLLAALSVGCPLDWVSALLG
jgi:hypothetical protein